MRKLLLLGAGALALSACGASTPDYTQADADALAAKLRNKQFVVVSHKLDNHKVSKRVTKKKIEVLVKVRGCILEMEQRPNEAATRLDEWLGQGGSENTITDFPKLNPTLADANKWADDHKQQLKHCYVAPAK